MILWVIGAGGLLGSAVVRAAQVRGWTVFPGTSIPWSDPDNTLNVVLEDAKQLADMLKPGQRWAIVWAAGRATTASRQEEADIELSVFTRSISVIKEQLGSHEGGAFLLASSAGGVYAGSSDPPFDSATSPHPTGIYGHLKRRQEIEAEQTLAEMMNVVIARIANLYGPGQDLSKLQGLISRLALTAITKQALTMFVPLETIRDFIHVNDAAHVALHWLAESTAAARVRVIATGSSTTLGYVVSQMKDITRTQIPVSYGTHPSAAYQARDLRLIPDCSPSTVTEVSTTLPEGMKSVYADVLLRYQQGRAQTLWS